ncbi:unnamed protein product [Triticum turgidum subsp. durum]|uniref:GST N-terminal domain-containing protein n=1 Tax=Triticum turgidum subsp. durum TaxID=4567 RepID=A0A9R0SVB8_TRITD|nr:unnamed protein product [Triticum turgidum subsp. durum]
MSPVKVFGHPMLTNVARVLLFLEEVGAEYELVPVDFVAGEHKRPQHVQLNVSRRQFVDGSPYQVQVMISDRDATCSRLRRCLGSKMANHYTSVHTSVHTNHSCLGVSC